ncbi:MAG: Hsp33 family molecular chaperone HslO [Alphaproteobacteria bacterium]|nr:Hsp33 family molecular chaperone HslO [Alphaproteobacteria bacterium]
MTASELTDFMQPFWLRPDAGPNGNGGAKMHGRMTRLGPVADDILKRHAYPEPVGTLLGESLALAASLAGGLKFDGVFTLQIQAKGPVSLVVVDATSRGELRGYAQFDAGGLPKAEKIAAGPVPALLGEGHFAFTVDMGPDKDRYQGIVEIEGNTLTDCAHHYFRRSEQMNTGIVLAARRRPENGAASDSSGDSNWWAGSLLLQQLPEAGGIRPSSADGDDPWRRAMMLLATSTDDELLDGDLGPETYLTRLFHQEGLGLAAPRPWVRGCRCSATRMHTALKGLPEDDRRFMVIDGQIKVTCEFCNTTRNFDPETLELVGPAPDA